MAPFPRFRSADVGVGESGRMCVSTGHHVLTSADFRLEEHTNHKVNWYVNPPRRSRYLIPTSNHAKTHANQWLLPDFCSLSITDFG